MWRALLPVLFLALPAPPAAAATPKQHPICGPAKARTIAKTHRLRVYRVPSRYGGTTDHVCSRYSARRWTLTDPDDGDCYSSQGCSGRTRLLVAGRWVLEVVTHSGNDVYSWITLRAAGARREAAFTRVDHLYDAVLHENGGVVWMALNHESYDPLLTTTFVARFEGCGPTTLDSGEDIHTDSLRLDLGRVTWLRGGVRHVGELCPHGR